MRKNTIFCLLGFIAGLSVAAIFSVPELFAQYGVTKNSGVFEESPMSPSVPAGYGKLVAVSGIDMYFQGDDGSVYIVKPRTGGSLDTRVTVVKRGE